MSFKHDQGCPIRLASKPPRQKKLPRQIPTSCEGKIFMSDKIKELLENGLIRVVKSSHPNGWVSNMFLVPKKMEASG